MTLEIYGDYISQPVRAVFALATIESSAMGDFKIIEISITKNDHKKSSEYRAINPFMKMPALKEEDFTMFESHAMMKYICKSRNLSEHWYPHK